MLQWCVERALAIDTQPDTVTSARCSTDGNRAILILEDNSTRLPESLRERLFLPFGERLRHLKGKHEVEGQHPGAHIPLFLARLLVELRNKGTLEDQTRKKDGDLGHRFVIDLPAYSG